MEDARSKLVDIISADKGRLGAFLNTMVSDLGIMDKGEYLRKLFNDYPNNLATEILKDFVPRDEVLDLVELCPECFPEDDKIYVGCCKCLQLGIRLKGEDV